MSDRRYYFAAEQRRYNTSAAHDCDAMLLYPCNNNNNNNADGDAEPEEPDADKDEDSDFLHDVPYSSSSVDRSSIGSIPWADDAIKKNKVDWECVERMLSGEEALPEQEPELRNEILDWQRKFPSLVGRKAKPLKQQSFDSSRTTMPDDIDSMSNLSLNSLDNDDDDLDDDDDGFLTPTVERQHRGHDSRQRQQHEPTLKYLRPAQNLVDILDKDLRITSVKLRKRERDRSTPPAPPTPQPQPQVNPRSATLTAGRARLRMPPILNVLDSNRRFRGLLNNRSFVQLTQVQQQLQAKSAALSHGSSADRRINRSAWHVPVAAATFSSRFLNNKHAIVLPALNRHRERDFATVATTTATSSQSNSSGGGAHNSHSNSSSLGSGSVMLRGAAGRRPIAYNQQHHQFSVPAAARGGTNSSNTPSTGRSISAAVHHPRSEFATNAFYIPYSASKFKAFK